MLSSNPITPRPRPPAKMRRSLSQTRVQNTLAPAADCDSNPGWRLRAPPPYAPFEPDVHHHPTLLGSPITATSQLIRLEEVSENINDLGDTIQEKSKEELEELLRRAAEMIKERERELDITSETCRTLGETNASLKARNDALISRLPPSQPTSPLASPSLLSGLVPSSLLSLSPSHSRSSSRSLLLSPKPFSSFSSAHQSVQSIQSVRRRPGGAPGHVRRISSTTPAELAALADQNAELLAKLADLEAEASRTEQAGKRRLRNLEAEIDTLREELETAMEERERLEEEMSANVLAKPEGAVAALAGLPLPAGLDKQVVKLFKRLSREAKVRELKAKTRPWDPDPEQIDNDNERLGDDAAPRDFAPNNLTPGLPYTSRIVGRKVSAPNLSIDTSLCQSNSNSRTSATGPKFPLLDSPTSSIPPSATSTLSTLPTTPNAREQALVSQLLLKIRELEETNAQLATNHLQASIRLREAQTESEGVRRLCEFISEEVDAEREGDDDLDIDLELEVVDDHEEENKNMQEEVEDHSNDSYPSQHRNESRKIVRLRSVSRKTSMDFGSGNSSRRHNVRLRKFKSVDSLPPLESSPPPPLPDSSSFKGRGNVAVGVRGDSHDDRRYAAAYGPKTRKTVLGLFEPTQEREEGSPSFDGPFTHHAHSDSHSHRHRLPSVHESFDSADTTRIASDADQDMDVDAHRNAEESIGEGADTSRMTSLWSELGLDLDNDVTGLRPATALIPAPGLGHGRTKSIMELLRSAELAPPSPSLLSPSILSPSGPGFLSPVTTSTLVVEPEPKGPGERGEGGGTYFPTPMDERITYPRLRRAKTSASLRSPAPSSPSIRRRWADDADTNLTHRVSHSLLPPNPHSPLNFQETRPEPKPRSRTDKLRALLLELWLWLYFAAIILVFVFSMARKGPKVVLSNKGSKASTRKKV